ncbi:MAG: T9SS type A sorting domain-containing protein [Crocinitomicaceae bacterium]|nr:T9SS type A sorting domain-containing protein [Crocinitomicaceae bacterium]
MKISQLCLLTFLFLFARNTEAQNTQQLLTKFYFESDLPILDSSGFEYSDVYSQSGSSWAIDSFPESVVFHNRMSYQNSINPNSSYDIRIGKGGQLYSFRGAFGESVPPQWVNPNWVQPSYGGGHSYAPWVDEVWQLVSVDGSIHNPPDSSYFIHQAGVYLKTPEQTDPFYSPILAEYFNADEQSYSVVNWGQQAHTEDLQNINHDAGLLYYTKYTNKGKGIIQVDNMIYNFGQDNMNFLNVPWGGVRNSSLDHFFISTPSHDYNLTTGLYGQTPVIQTANTGGWVAWSNDIEGDSPTLGMAHPTTTNTYGNKFRYGDAGNLSNVNNLRDYHVFEMIRQPIGGQLGFGKAMSFRYFYVLGASVDSVKSTILENDLIGHGLDTSYVASISDVDSLRYSFQFINQEIIDEVTSSNNGLLLRTSPFSDSYPLFKLSSSNGVDLLSSDPYSFSEFAYDGNTTEMKLLGFRDAPTIVTLANDTICYGEGFTFPDGVSWTDMSQDSSHISHLSGSQFGWDSLVINNIITRQLDESLDIQQACFSYLWQDGNTYTSSTNTPSITLSNQYGCDSIVYLNLIIDTVNINTTINDLELQSMAVNSVYQWVDCENDFSAIQGQDQNSYEVQTNGSYAVVVTQGNCVDTSECITIEFVGLSTEDLKGLSLYPNPTTDIIYLNGFDKLNDLKKIELMDNLGILLEKIEIKNRQIDLSNLAKGIYYLEVTVENKNSRIKIVKQ